MSKPKANPLTLTLISTKVQIEDGPAESFPNRQLLGRNFTNLTATSKLITL